MASCRSMLQPGCRVQPGSRGCSQLPYELSKETRLLCVSPALIFVSFHFSSFFSLPSLPLHCSLILSFSSLPLSLLLPSLLPLSFLLSPPVSLLLSFPLCFPFFLSLSFSCSFFPFLNSLSLSLSHSFFCSFLFFQSFVSPSPLFLFCSVSDFILRQESTKKPSRLSERLPVGLHKRHKPDFFNFFLSLKLCRIHAGSSATSSHLMVWLVSAALVLVPAEVGNFLIQNGQILIPDMENFPASSLNICLSAEAAEPNSLPSEPSLAAKNTWGLGLFSTVFFFFLSSHLREG